DRLCLLETIGRGRMGLRLAWRLLAVVVLNGVAEAKHRPQTPAERKSLERAQLARVWVENDIWLAVRAERQKAHSVLCAVDELMPATLAAQKGHHFSLLQLPPSIRRAQARLAVQDNDKLLLGEVVVVGIGGFAGRQLPQAQPQPVASGLAADA